ncbi:MAG: DUF6683 family protein [Pyrinomonadaceae bacterium]
MGSIAANAQLVNGTNVNNMDMLLSRVILCGSFRKANKPLPSTCQTGSAGRGGTTSGAAKSTAAKPPVKGLVKFSPVAGDDSFQKFTNDNGSTAEEKQLMLQIANATKSLFEERYAAKGWKNNVAGGFAFFIISNMTVYSGKEPGEVSQNALFEMLDSSLSQSSEFANASNKDKQALYNTLIAYSGVPLTFFADGAQKGDKQEIEKARTIAAGYIRMFLKTEPESLLSLVE